MGEREPYPLHLKIWGDVGDGVSLATSVEGNLINSFGAIQIEIKVDSSDYPKAELYRAIKETAMKAAEYFH